MALKAKANITLPGNATQPLEAVPLQQLPAAFVGTLATSATTQTAITTATSLNATILLHNLSRTGAWADILNKPTYQTSATGQALVPTATALPANMLFHNVAKSGSYNDLTNLPTIPPAFTGTLATSLNDPQGAILTPISFNSAITLHQVAGTGAYFDLLGLPYIQTSATTQAKVPTATQIGGTLVFHDLAKSGSYNDALNRPLYQTSASVQALIPTATTITGTLIFHDVAKSGNYNDLIDKPNIPSIIGLATETWVTNNYQSKAPTGGQNVDILFGVKNGSWTEITGLGGTPFTFDGTLSTVATSLSKLTVATTTNAPIQLHDLARTGAWADILNKPTYQTSATGQALVPTATALPANMLFHNIAKSGSYNDQTNLPTLLTMDATAATIISAAGATAAAGTATTAAHRDHVHGIATAAPVALGETLATGTSTSFSRADHVHPYPDGLALKKVFTIPENSPTGWYRIVKTTQYRRPYSAFIRISQSAASGGYGTTYLLMGNSSPSHLALATANQLNQLGHNIYGTIPLTRARLISSGSSSDSTYLEVYYTSNSTLTYVYVELSNFYSTSSNYILFDEGNQILDSEVASWQRKELTFIAGGIISFNGYWNADGTPYFGGTLATTATSQSVITTPISTNAAILLHNVARTGSYNDLTDKPAAGGVASYKTTFTGTGALTNFTVTHNLNSQDVMMQVYQHGTGNKELVMIPITLATVNTATISFETAPPSTETYSVFCIKLP